MSPLGFMNWAWLKILKNSPRISNDSDSLIGTTFVIPKSVLLKPGPWKNRRFAVPKLPQSGPVKAAAPPVVVVRPQTVGANALWLKYVHVPGVERGFWVWIGPTRFGISVDGLPTSEESPWHIPATGHSTGAVLQPESARLEQLTGCASPI